MRLQTQQVNALVATLEIEHNKKYNSDEDGLSDKETKEIKARAKRVRLALIHLPKDAKKYLDMSGSFYNGKPLSEKIILEELKEEYINDRDNKERKKGKRDLSVFDREEVKRKIIMTSMSCKTLEELSKKLGIKI